MNSNFFDKLPSTSSLLSAYATISTFLMLFKTFFNQIVSKRLRDLISDKLSDFMSSYFSSDFTFVAEQRRWEINEIFRAAETYLPTKIGPSTRSLRLLNTINRVSNTPEVAIPVGGGVVDVFEGVQVTWTLESHRESEDCPEIKIYKLKCKRQYKDLILYSYLPHVLSTAKSIECKRKGLKIYNYVADSQYWKSRNFNHPASFDTLALEPELKKSIIDDLDMFVTRKDYFKRVGRAWKRGYLLYGPPGTGKSTLVAAMANYLHYSIYDLQFASVSSDNELRNILTSTTNRSILLIEDIDCNCSLSLDRKSKSNKGSHTKAKSAFLESKLTLSGLLNFIDGLWSCFGDERIIVFTTNHKDMLDPALLRPGRMDFPVYMGYCGRASFRELASLYLEIKDHKLFETIEDSLEKIQVTPAEVAQQLMVSNVPDVALRGLIEYLSVKKDEKQIKGDGTKDDSQEEDEHLAAKERAEWDKIYLT